MKQEKARICHGKPLLFYTLVIVVVVLFVLAIVLVVFILAVVLVVFVLAVVLIVSVLAIILLIILTVVLSVIHLYHHLFGNDIVCGKPTIIQTQWLFVCGNSRENIANYQCDCPQNSTQQAVERNRHQKRQLLSI